VEKTRARIIDRRGHFQGEFQHGILEVMDRLTPDPIQPPQYNTLEAAIGRIGKALLDRSAGSSPTLFNRRRWSNTLLDWCMKDETFKIRLFRFIDVLPSLKHDRQVARLLEEYFQDLPSLAGPLQWGLRAMSATALGARLSAHSLRQQIIQMAKMFIAGTSVADAGPTLSQLWKDGRACSIDLLGEASVSELEADRYRDRCLDALLLLGRETAAWPSNKVLEQDHLGMIPRVQLSVKLSALYSQLDPVDPEGAYRALAGRLRPLLDFAGSIPAAITFDMEQAETKNIVLMTFMRLLSEDAYRAYPHAGIALQAYTKDSGADLARLIEWVRQRRTPIGVRLVKGAYWDSEMIRYRQRGWPVPVFETKPETDANYERLSRMLIEHIDVLRPAFGTHNLRSLTHAEAAAHVAQVPSEAYEYQMIFGMAEPLQTAVTQFGRRVRIYTPVGDLIPGMAYLVRRLLENTSNESFLRREYSEKEPLDLLSPPPVSVPSAATDGQAVPPPMESTHHADRFLNEPHTDFSQDATRSAMQTAVSRVKAQLGRRVSLAASSGISPSGPAILSRNPSNPDEVVGQFHACSLEDIPRVVETSRRSVAGWSSISSDDRAAMLVQAASLMRTRHFDLAAWEIFETGKSWREADADVAEAIDFLEFYAGEMRRLSHGRRLGHAPGELNEVLHAPRGIAAVIAPWNFPLAIPTGMVAAALVTGNAVLFKPSERASVLGLLLTQLLHEAGVPLDALQILPGGPDIGQALASHPEVDLIAFTGSKTVGLQLLAHSAQVTADQRTVKRVIAEMGGKNAIIIDDTADLDEAVIGVVTSFTGYQGQKCSACSRAIVHESIYEVFLQRLTEAVMSLHVGPPEDPTHVMGPMIDARALAKVQDYLKIGTQEGRLIVAGKTHEPGYFITPTIVADIQPHHRLAQEEIFGPLLAVMKARDFKEALNIANNSPYALTGGVYSRSPAHIQTARTAFDVGNLYINRPITGALVGRQPFGGHRLSGVGAKAGGEDYLSQFMITRVVSENTLRRGFAPSEF
jgi:RHH-type transcriptional regulator, proline utilization regulon repressor / proline dehydrogenase / delta 1-pyrroline-5-carboxylate dehydrogenase